MRWWKIVGMAGLAGVAATGVLTVRDERRRQAYTPDEIRARLHERVAEVAAAEHDEPAADPDAATGGRLRRLTAPAGRLVRRLRDRRPRASARPGTAGLGTAGLGTAGPGTAGPDADRARDGAVERYRLRVQRLRGRIAARLPSRRSRSAD